MIRAAALQTIRGRLGYRDVLLMQLALSSFMGQSKASDAPSEAGVEGDTVDGMAVDPSIESQASAHSEATSSAAPPASTPTQASPDEITDRSALSYVMSVAFPEIDVVVTNDIGGTELPLAAVRVEDVHASTISWHFQNRSVLVAGMHYFGRASSCVHVLSCSLVKPCSRFGPCKCLIVIAVSALRLSAEFYNAERSVWESLIEPWSLRIQQLTVRARSCMQAWLPIL